MLNSVAGYRLLLTLALAGVAAAPLATSANAATRSLYEMTATEAKAAQDRVQADPRVAAMLGFGPALAAVATVELSKADTVPFLSGQTAKPPSRYVTVVLFNQKTNTAARAVVELGTMRVASVEAATLDDIPLFREEAEQALAIARGDPKLRAAIGASLDSFRVRPSGSDVAMPYAADVVPVATSSVRDQCFTGRCVRIHFRAPTGYLALSAFVNIARRTVTVVRANPRRGMHH